MGYQDFFDREGKSIAFGWWSQGIAPTGQVERISYTVPAGKAALISIRSASIMCITPATTRAFAASWHRDQLVSSGLREILAAQGPGNNAGDNAQIAIGVAGPIRAGDEVVALTVDLSTGGTCAFQVGLEVLEFDRKIT